MRSVSDIKLIRTDVNDQILIKIFHIRAQQRIVKFTYHLYQYNINIKLCLQVARVIKENILKQTL